MNVNSDWDALDECPATPEEEQLGRLLEEVIDGLERGKVVKAETLRGYAPDTVKQGEELIEVAMLLYKCACSVSENSSPPIHDEPRGMAADRIGPPPIVLGHEDGRTSEFITDRAEMAGALPDPFPGEFRIRRLLGQGNFGTVWLADDLNLGRQVAIKTLTVPTTSTWGPHVLAALRNEAQCLAQLDHPNIIPVYQWREAQDGFYLVLPFVAGRSLADRLAAEKILTWKDATRYVADVGEALLAVHQRNVVHRDVKPDNILWDPVRDEAMLTDFGLSVRLSEPGLVAGTAMYMAPEAFEGHISPAIDVYSLAATFFRLATGKFPFFESPRLRLLEQKRLGLPDPDPRCEGVPEELERIIRKGLAAQPESRPTLDEFVTTLRGEYNRLLADDFALVAPAGQARAETLVNLRVVISRRVSGDVYQTVSATKSSPPRATRDMRRIPPRPDQVGVRTGDFVRVEVVADKSGYLTVFNVGPTGNLNMLFPDEGSATSAPIEAHRPLHVVDVQMTPPIGRERVFAVWGVERLPISPGQLLAGQVRTDGSSIAHRSTRDMKRVKASMASRPDVAWTTAVVEVNHVQP